MKEHVKFWRKKNNQLFAYAFLLGSIIVTSLFSGCTTQKLFESGISEEGNDLVIGLLMDTLGFHPWMEAYDIETMSVNSNIFNSLVEFDKDFRITPSLATSWNNPDNLTWRFHLREGVTFHNGYSFSAEDVKYTIELIQNDETSVLRDLIASITNVTIIDNYTIDIRTDQPNPILLNKLVDIFIVSKQYQEETTDHWPIGTGAFQLKEYSKDDYILLERFDEYWKGAPEVRRINFKIFHDYEIRKSAFLNKTIDICGVHPDDYAAFSSTPGIRLQTISSPTVFYLSFNFRPTIIQDSQEVVNPVANLSVRKAIYHAINIDNIIDTIFNGFDTPASQFVTPLIFGYNPEIQRLPYNVTQAQQLMKDAGYQDGFEIEFDCTDDNETLELCEEFVNYLADINITLKLNPVSVNEYYNRIDSGESSFYMIGWLASTADGGEIFDYLLRTNDPENAVGSYNSGGYSNSEVDRVGEKISTLMDPEERLQLMQEGFALAMDDVAWIPLLIPQEIFATQDYIDYTPRGDLSYKVEEIGFFT
jgi:peptide/nickel transport system substrate-binding protein